MKILGYIFAILGLIALFLNGKPRQWGKNCDGMAAWKHILIDVGAALLMVSGLALIGKI